MPLSTTGRGLCGSAGFPRELEDEAEALAHQTVGLLHRTFVTPFDRDEIYRFSTMVDDVIGAMEAAAERLWLYEVRVATPEVRRLALTLVDATMQLKIVMNGLRDVRRDRERILAACREVSRLENANDETSREGLARLFKSERDAVLIMKWKEIYEILEQATDRCEDVVNLIAGAVLENE